MIKVVIKAVYGLDRKCLEILEEDTPGSGDSGTKINKKKLQGEIFESKICFFLWIKFIILIKNSIIFFIY